MSSPKKLYWDSSCFICFLNRNDVDKARRIICEDVIRHSSDFIKRFKWLFVSPHTAERWAHKIWIVRFGLNSVRSFAPFSMGGMMIDANEVSELVTASHPDVHRLLGIADCADPEQAARRMVRSGQVPHMRIGGRRIRFSLPALRKWAAEKITNSIAATTAQKPIGASASAQ